MSEPTPPPSSPSPPTGPNASSPSSAGPAAAASASANASGPRPPPEPLTGFRASLEHTGIPRSVLLWKPRLPSRNWTIFWTLLGTVSYIYYDDRRKCREIKEEYLRKVEGFGKEATTSSLDMPRKVTVYGAKWPEDEDTDRALRHFRKYVKPYLVAAAIDYEQVTAPLHGSITRQVHANVLKRRRQALGLEAPDPTLSLPIALDPRSALEREVEGGVVLVGRASLKEYLEGLRRGWSNGVGPWDWEKEVEEKIRYDGVFDDLPAPALEAVSEAEDALSQTPQQTPPPAKSGLGLGFLSRPAPPPPVFPSSDSSSTPPAPTIPEHLHTPPNPLPPTAPVLLLPFVNHLGFKQTPWMIYDFFTEHRRVKAGADAAYALITDSIRSFSPPDSSSAVEGSAAADTHVHVRQGGDLDFNLDAEKYYGKSFSNFPEKIKTAREDYYKKLSERLDSARALAKGEREMTEEEKKSTKGPVTEEQLREERRKKELRWHGNLEGWEIMRKEAEVAWDPRWDGWLRVYETPEHRVR
ncbi:mitochondrial import inner membrane translocase subunit tim54 [Saitozyma podzolica]|uniref:Mitochondrial import inner membrane translocase subunit TIM54 n=1 Tax=Saitozyma podzolica TaxID=1890683 RepID=A0A427YEJ0_9TREE|nr:mitochondrial import inner membrane translocase subunit tim54 [Saitozyma podzolica]